MTTYAEMYRQIRETEKKLEQVHRERDAERQRAMRDQLERELAAVGVTGLRASQAALILTAERRIELDEGGGLRFRSSGATEAIRQGLKRWLQQEGGHFREPPKPPSAAPPAKAPGARTDAPAGGANAGRVLLRAALATDVAEGQTAGKALLATVHRMDSRR